VKADGVVSESKTRGEIVDGPFTLAQQRQQASASGFLV
jgi:hypothetical protein